MNWLPATDANALVLIFQYFDAPLLAVFWIGFGGCLLVIWVITWTLRLRGPRLYFGIPEVRNYPVGSPGNQTIWNVASVPLFNDPRMKTASGQGGVRDATANSVFVDLETKKTVSNKQFSRWADNTQPGQSDAPSNVSKLKFRDFPPNDSPNLINLAMKARNDVHCYALNFESWPSIGTRPPSQLVNSQEILIVVTIKSSNAPNLVGQFVLKHDRSVSLLSIEVYPSWVKRVGLKCQLVSISVWKRLVRAAS